MNPAEWHRAWPALCIAAVLALAGSPSHAQSGAGSAGAPMVVAAAPATQLAPVTVVGHYNNGVGTTDAASQGTVTSS